MNNGKFEKEYWQQNYLDPQDMDGIYNAADHAQFLKLFFKLEHIDIHSMIDFGMGPGHMLTHMIKAFRPKRVAAIDPSLLALKKSERRINRANLKCQIKIEQRDLETWAKLQKPSSPRFDLGICTSVIQYIDNKSMTAVLSAMAKKVKYLYLTVPTDIEYRRMYKDFRYRDSYANSRTQQFYLKKLRPHFTVVGQRVLESKTFFDVNTTKITELLYRF